MDYTIIMIIPVTVNSKKTHNDVNYKSDFSIRL